MVDFLKLIEEFAEPAVIKKARSIKAQGRVLKLDFGIDDELPEDNVQFDATVLGEGGIYECYVDWVYRSHMDYDCSCPYDWGDPCKHIVAALLEVADHIHSKAKSQKTKTKKQKLDKRKGPFQIPLSGGITVAQFQDHPSFQLAIQSWSWYCHFYDWKDDIQISSVGSGAHNRPVIVKFSINTNLQTLDISSSSKPNGEHLSLEEMRALIFFINSGYLHGLMLQVPEYRAEMVKNTAKKYGISDENLANKIFRVDERNLKNQIQLSEDYEGLLPMAMLEKSSNLSITPLLPEESLLSLENSKSSDDRKLFFCLENHPGDNHFGVLSISPFVARVKKNGSFYKTGIKYYDELSPFENIDIAPEDSKLVEDCINTIPSRFSAQYGQRIRKITNGGTKELFIYNENIKQLQSIFQSKQIFENRLFIHLHSGYYNKLEADNFRPISSISVDCEVMMELSSQDGLVTVAPQIISSENSKNIPLSVSQTIHPLAFLSDEEVYILKNASDAILLKNTFGEKSQLMTHESQFKPFFEQIIKPLSTSYPISIKELPGRINLKESKLTFMKKKIYLKELDKFILFYPKAAYGDLEVDVLDAGSTMNLFDNQLEVLERDHDSEQQFLDEIKELHEKLSKPTFQGFYSMHFDEFIEDYWFLKLMDKAAELKIEVYGFNEFKNFQYSPFMPSFNVKGSSSQDWFDLEVEVTVGDLKIPLKEVRKAIISKDKFIKLGNGKLAILPEEWIKRLERYFRIGTFEKDSIQVDKLRFNVLEELFEDIDQREIVLEIAKKKKKLKEYEAIKQVELPTVDATLRPYQIDGYQWMHFLHEFNWGGILADDMGLGKTLQMITFLKSLVDQGLSNHLVIVPTTLLFNWENEINKFCPTLKYHIYHGTNREKENPDWSDYDLVITTYGLLVSDAKMLSEMEFNYVVLDESQAIKNPGSKRYKAARLLQAKNRIVMTGTPIENNTFDLFAQMSFVNPGLFINAENFKKQYAIPIDRHGDSEVAKELSNMISPFLLRRTKEHVAKELPEKTEDVIYCEMDKAQRKVYDAYRNEYRNEIMGLVESGNIESSSLHVLQALTKLRQICNSPALLSDDENYGSDSVKIKELLQHIEKKTGYHKILVFSQFVGMLGLIRKELDKLDISYSYLDGQTPQKDRQKAVDSFQNEADKRVFLISLKAGGTGLNLTAADYVYIVDPWWNPAVENQAIDRCYRIGQDKHVIAYRMICVDTLEEKIMQLKSQKQNLADSIIHTDENISKQITKEDLMYILS